MRAVHQEWEETKTAIRESIRSGALPWDLRQVVELDLKVTRFLAKLERRVPVGIKCRFNYIDSTNINVEFLGVPAYSRLMYRINSRSYIYQIKDGQSSMTADLPEPMLVDFLVEKLLEK